MKDISRMFQYTHHLGKVNPWKTCQWKINQFQRFIKDIQIYPPPGIRGPFGARNQHIHCEHINANEMQANAQPLEQKYQILLDWWDKCSRKLWMSNRGGYRNVDTTRAWACMWETANFWLAQFNYFLAYNWLTTLTLTSHCWRDIAQNITHNITQNTARNMTTKCENGPPTSLQTILCACRFTWPLIKSCEHEKQFSK